MSKNEKTFEDVGSIKEVAVDVPHAEKDSVKRYQRHHKFGHNHVEGSVRHPDRHGTGGKFKRTKRDDRTHSYRKPDDEDGIRVEKKIADLLGCSKEDVHKMIKDEKLKVNNIVVKDLSLRITFDDTIHINGRLIPNKKIPLKVYILHKPKGYIVSNNDPQGRPVIFDIIPSKLGKLITIGRLDFNSEGLLLLTNNGDFARMMELPATGVQREYRVRVFGDYDMEKMRQLKNGIEINGVKYGPIFVTEEKEGNTESANKWLRVTLYEGKNREIRNVMENFGLQVNRLIRLSYGKYNLGTLPNGCVMEVKPITNHGRVKNTGDRDFKKKKFIKKPKKRD